MGDPWGPVVAGRGGDVAGGGRRSIGASGGRGWESGGVVVVLVVPCPPALRVWWFWHAVDVCGRWLLAGLLG